MRLIFAICCMVHFPGCAEVLRTPELEIDSVVTVNEKHDFNVTLISASTEVIAEANQTEFKRFVATGGGQGRPVSIIQEDELFSSPVSEFNLRQAYKLGVGDEIEISNVVDRAGARGVSERTSYNDVYTIQDNGTIQLVGGRSVHLAGKTIAAARRIVSQATKYNGSNSGDKKPFPRASRSTYEIGVGDQIQISRTSLATESANGSTTTKTELTNVGTDGTIRLAEIGEVEILGLSLVEARQLIQKQAIRNAVGGDILVNIKAFNSQSVLVTGDLGNSVKFIDENPLTIDRLIADLDPDLSGEANFTVLLERNGRKYQMSARSIMFDFDRDVFHLFNGDRISFRLEKSQSEVKLDLLEANSNVVTFVRASDLDEKSSKTEVVRLGSAGLNLRQLLVGQGVILDQNNDLLVRVVRGQTEMKLSANALVFRPPTKRLWLAAGDHVVVEDINYFGADALLVGEFTKPNRLQLDIEKRTTLGEALFEGEIYNSDSADFQHVYVLRSRKSYDFTAIQFDFGKVLNLALAEQLELRPGDILFVRTRPISKFNRVLSEILPSISGTQAAISLSKN